MIGNVLTWKHLFVITQVMLFCFLQWYNLLHSPGLLQYFNRTELLLMLFVTPVLYLQQEIKKVCCGKRPLLPVIKTQSIFNT